MLNSKFKTFKYSTSQKDPFPQVFNLQIFEQSLFSISCIDRHYRYTREIIDYQNNCYIIVCKYSDNKIVHIDSDFNTNSSVDLILDLDKGNYLIWVWNDFDHSFNILNQKKEKEIKISISCSNDFFIRKNSKDIDFKLLKYIIYEDICQNNNIKEKDFISFSGNMFQNSGISYKLLINNYKDKKLITNHDFSGLENCYLIEKYPNEIIVESLDWDIILGCRSNYVGTYWFNIKSKIKTSNLDSVSIKKGLIYSEIKEIFCISNFNNENDKINYDYVTKLTNDQDSINLKNNEYDHNSIKLENLKEKVSNNKENDLKSDVNNLKFVSKDLKIEKSKLIQLKEKYPNEMSILLKEFNNQSKINEFLWIEKIHDNGLYLGQVNNKNERHGYGIYAFKNNSGYYGNWENNKKNGFGITYIDNFKISYRGNFKDNQMNGFGEFYYNNGDVFEGNFTNGLKNGKGTYKWKNSCKWIGNFSQNEMDGDGLFYNEKGECFGLSYSNGKVKSLK